jgi:hypothetical protein
MAPALGEMEELYSVLYGCQSELDFAGALIRSCGDRGELG